MNKRIDISKLEQYDVFFMWYNGVYEKFVVLNVLENEGYLVQQICTENQKIFLNLNNDFGKEIFYHKHLGMMGRFMLWFTYGITE